MTIDTIIEQKPAPKRRGRPPKKKPDGGLDAQPKRIARRPSKKATAAAAALPADAAPVTETRPASEMNYIFAVGRRKRAVARVFVYRAGNGEIIINGKPFDTIITTALLRDIVIAPLSHSPFKNRVRIVVQTRGGGVRGQAEAAQLGITRALLKMDENLRLTFRSRGFLTRDPREKERKKPGLKRARRAPQWQKR